MKYKSMQYKSITFLKKNKTIKNIRIPNDCTDLNEPNKTATDIDSDREIESFFVVWKSTAWTF